MEHDPWRPRFHYSAARDWISDPSGLVWFDGEYHLFYLHNPTGERRGHTSWGHAVSGDLVHWQELPVALAADERVSILCGSVVADDRNSSGFGDGVSPPLVALYTGGLRRSEGGQAQELAYSLDNGRSWTQHAGNPVLVSDQREFRDPKVFWHDAGGHWVMVVAFPLLRRVAFYTSRDLQAWKPQGHFEAPFEGQGIWESPELIEMSVPGGGTAWLLKVDVLEGHPSGGSGARLFFGRFDGRRFVAEPESAPQWADRGADFCGARAWSNLRRPLWIGWMNCDRYASHTPTAGWRGAMSVPRELSLRRTAHGLQLLQRPVPELQALRSRPLFEGAVTVRQTPFPVPLADTGGRVLEIELVVERSDAAEYGLVLRAGDGEETRVGVDTARGTVFVDRTRSGVLLPDPVYAARHEAPGRGRHLHVLLDRSSLEVFVDDGELVFSEQIFPRDDSRGLRLYSRAGTTRFAGVHLWSLGD